jgi:hypothetical protein
VLEPDRVGVVEQRVDQREPDDVRLGAGRRGAGQPGLTGRQLCIDLDLALAGGGVERERAVRGGAALLE